MKAYGKLREPAVLLPREEPIIPTQLIGGWVRHRAYLDLELKGELPF
jgi:hypothetical protein